MRVPSSLRALFKDIPSVDAVPHRRIGAKLSIVSYVMQGSHMVLERIIHERNG